MRLLVMGANGLVGSRLCRLLVEQGHDVVGASRGERRVPGAFEYHSCDVTHPAEVVGAVAAARPEVIINVASMTDVDGCERAPEQAYAANAEAPAHLSREARKCGAHLVHTSTDYVFDGDRGGYGEDDTPNPRGIYATSKYVGELAVRSLAGSWAIARPAVVYGWPPAGRPNFGSWLLSSLVEGKPVRLFEDQFVSPSLADSVAAMLAEIALRRLTGVFHTSGAEVVDRVRFGRALCEEFSLDPKLITPVKLRDAKFPSPRPLNSGLQVDKVRRELREKPLTLAEALTKFHDAYRANPIPSPSGRGPG
jgi:dTDP-4-dehydrorhamnose reductase